MCINNQSVSGCAAFLALIDGKNIIDVRSQGEFLQSFVPGEICQPILNDSERQQVGLTYHLEGQEAAIELGLSLVQGSLKEQRVESWANSIKTMPVYALSCARGGLRSEFAQRWLSESKFEVPRVVGGYKAIRNQCLSALEQEPGQRSYLIVAGLTGAGKSQLLQELSSQISVVDLEALANHRGSSFGGFIEDQPSQASFENSLALALCRIPAKSLVLVENESRFVGRCLIPLEFWKEMQEAPRIVVEDSLENRALSIYQIYLEQANKLNPTDAGYFLTCLERIKKSLGGINYETIEQKIRNAFYADKMDPALHLEWISALLQLYYDPRYLHSMNKSPYRVDFSGSRKEVAEYILNLQSGFRK